MIKAQYAQYQGQFTKLWKRYLCLVKPIAVVVKYEHDQFVQLDQDICLPYFDEVEAQPLFGSRFGRGGRHPTEGVTEQPTGQQKVQLRAGQQVVLQNHRFAGQHRQSDNRLVLVHHHQCDRALDSIHVVGGPGWSSHHPAQNGQIVLDGQNF